MVVRRARFFYPDFFLQQYNQRPDPALWPEFWPTAHRDSLRFGDVIGHYLALAQVEESAGGGDSGGGLCRVHAGGGHPPLCEKPAD